MKLRLIEPANKNYLFSHTKDDVKSLWFSRLSLVTVAALTPPKVEISLIDENIEDIDFGEELDVVGLTAMTMQAPRAYAIADEFRRRGVKVIMGGIHASTLPQEAKEHVDSVIIGEAEEVWPKVIEDLYQNSLKPFYQAEGPASLIGLPHPRRDLFKAGAYNTINCFQTGRGCPFACDFCSVSQFFGRTYRQRPVDEVIEELKPYAGQFVIFVDDNLVGNPTYAKEFFRRLMPLNIQWGGQSSLTIARDEELLKLAKASGCTSFFIGFETLSKENLASMNKSFNKSQDYEELIKKIRDHGISIIGSFIFGLDQDDSSVFERTVSFCEKHKIDLPTYHILTPLPGTRLYKRMEEEGRLLHKKWEEYNGSAVVFRPKLMPEDTLQSGYFWAYRETYSWSSIMKRLSYFSKRFLPTLILNKHYRQIAMRSPKEEPSAWATLLSKIRFSREVKDKTGLIPSTEWDQERKEPFIKPDLREGYGFFRLDPIGNERLKSLILRLEGSLDVASANRLIKTLQLIIKKGVEEIDKIIIDCKELKFFSPGAINTIIQEITKRVNEYRGKIEVINLHSSVLTTFKNLEPCLAMLKPPDLARYW
jgi:anti-anti-sigma factor